jgi:hypothetical protein
MQYPVPAQPAYAPGMGGDAYSQQAAMAGYGVPGYGTAPFAMGGAAGNMLAGIGGMPPGALAGAMGPTSLPAPLMMQLEMQASVAHSVVDAV